MKNAPKINWRKLPVAMFWASLIMMLLCACDSNEKVNNLFGDELESDSSTHHFPGKESEKKADYSSSSYYSDLGLSSVDLVSDSLIVDSTLVQDVDDLPACNSGNEGEVFMVGTSAAAYFCTSGKWVSAADIGSEMECSNGVLEMRPGNMSDLIGADTSSFVLRREQVPVKGFAEKGPFRYGASVKVIELDSAMHLEETKRSSKTCVTTADGSFQFAGVDFVSPYVKMEANGYYRNELTGGLSTSLVTLNALVDFTDRDSANVNMLTHLEAPRLMQLMGQGGFQQPLRNMKAQSFREILSAFEINLGSSGQGGNSGNGGFGGFGGWGGWGGQQQQSSFTPTKNAEDVTLFGGDDYSGALIAVSIMMQRKGSGSEMESYAGQIADRIKGNGNWDDNNAKADLADWLMLLDAEGGFADIRKNLESWNMGEVADFEKHLRNFWTKVHSFESCNAMTAGKVKHINNSMSAYFVSYYEQPTGPRVRFICDGETYQWRVATDIEKDTVGFGQGTYDGQIKPGKINVDRSYIYVQSTKSWRMATNDDIREFIDVRTVYDSLAADESVVFVLRHAERTDDTGKNGHLNDKGKKQSEQVGAKFKGIDLYFGNSGYTRTIETCDGLGKGSGLSVVEQDSLPFLNGDWFVKDADKLEKYRNSDGGGWVVFSKYAYQGGYTDALYNLQDRAEELIYDEIIPNLPNMKRVSFLISHDQMVLPLAVYSTEGKLNLRYFENQNWINYLAGVAIIVNGKGDVRLVPVKGLDSGIMH